MIGKTDVETQLPLLGRYRVETALGTGGSGDVVRAYDVNLKRRVAIKSIRRDLTTDYAHLQILEERFIREAEGLSRVGEHPNLITVYDFVTSEDRTLYLILEYAPGGTLADRLRHGRPPLAQALKWTLDIAHGLQACHDAGIVHRDVKPSNIFFAVNGRAQLGDFSIAQIDHLSMRTRAQIAHPGTPLYMSPEQEGTTGYLRPSSDQYSLGCVLFEMVTGQIYKRLEPHAAAELLDADPVPVAHLVRTMLAEHSADRYPSMMKVQDAIEAAIADPTTARGEGGAITLEDPLRRPQATEPTPQEPAPDAARAAAERETPPMADATPREETKERARRETPHINLSPIAALSRFAGLPLAGKRRILPLSILGVALVLALTIAVALATRGSSPRQGAPTVADRSLLTVSIALPSPTVAPTAVAQTAPIAAVTEVSTPIPTVVPTPTAPLPTSTPLPTATAVPPTPVPSLGVFGAGTTDQGNLEVVKPEDVVTTFTTGKEVFGFVNFGSAQPSKDVFEVRVTPDTPEHPPQSIPVPKPDGFLLFSLGQFAVGAYQVEVRYNGALVKQAAFQIVPPPTPVPVQPTVVPAVNRPAPVVAPAAPAAPVEIAPTAAPVAPTAVPAIVAPSPPAVSAPAAQPAAPTAAPARAPAAPPPAVPVPNNDVSNPGSDKTPPGG